MVTLPDTNQPEQPETLPLPAAPDADAQSAPQTGGTLPQASELYGYK